MISASSASPAARRRLSEPGARLGIVRLLLEHLTEHALGGCEIAVEGKVPGVLDLQLELGRQESPEARTAAPARELRLRIG